MSLFERFMSHLGYVPKSTILNDVEECVDKVMNESKVEVVEQVAMVRPKKHIVQMKLPEAPVYPLKFYKNGDRRVMAKYGGHYICTLHFNQKIKAQKEFDVLMQSKMSLPEIQAVMKNKFNKVIKGVRRV